MKSNSESIEDIKAIRKLMEESSRFLSLSGLSGVVAGILALAGALVAYAFMLDEGSNRFTDFMGSFSGDNGSNVKFWLIADAVAVLVISVLAAFYFSVRKARKDGKNYWTPVTRNMLVNLSIPLATGGIFAIALIIQDNMQFVIPCLLLFYGLSLVNAGKFTLGEVHYLGLAEVITGLVAAFIPGMGLVFWILGFGVFHIIYGLAMYRKLGA